MAQHSPLWDPTDCRVAYAETSPKWHSGDFGGLPEGVGIATGVVPKDSRRAFVGTYLLGHRLRGRNPGRPVFESPPIQAASALPVRR